MIAGGKNNLIGISGKIGSGKDTVGNIIQMLTQGIDSNTQITEYVNGTNITGFDYQIKKFADTIKDIACMLIGCTRAQLEDQEFKQKELGEEWWYCVADDGSYIPYEQNLHKNKVVNLVKLTPRKLLQLLGTECGRQIIHPNIWVNSLFADYKKDSNWIITDVRFTNEAQTIKDRGGIMIRINRPLYRLDDQHPSETALDNYNFDYVIENEGNIDELVQKIKQLKLV
tara:strand:+ start:919 stop:1599 length:681 start_codon:yes stop_codon:yes gene_type:complete